MQTKLFIAIILATRVSAGFFDFSFQKQPQEPATYEANALLSDCNKYVCPDTLACVDAPNKCPCPFPSSQLRCVLPNSEYVCISRPAGDNEKYDDLATNWKVDANDDNIRDCGWVSRVYNGKI